jgi:hypothetical protein
MCSLFDQTVKNQLGHGKILHCPILNATQELWIQAFSYFFLPKMVYKVQTTQKNYQTGMVFNNWIF